MDLHTFLVNQTSNTTNKSQDTMNSKKKSNGKHKANSNSNININKPKRYDNKSKTFNSKGYNQNNDFKKLPKSKKMINNWLDEIHEDERDFKSKPQGSMTLSNKKKHAHYSSHKQHDKLYLFGDSFINANYQILIKDTEALRKNLDGVIPFEFIERCITYQNDGERQSCPICLSDDISCGRMVKCGHIFCYQCLLQYIDSNEKKAEQEYLEKHKKSNVKVINNFAALKDNIHHDCPLCGDIINLKHVVPVSMNIDTSQVNTNDVVKEGQRVQMQLICRPKSSSTGLPVYLGIDPELISLPLVYDQDSIIDTRIPMNYFISDDVDIQFLNKDIQDLKEQSQMDQLLYNESDEFVLKAISEIEKKISKLREEHVTNKMPKNDLSIAYSGREQLLSKYNDENAYFYYEHIDKNAKRTFLDGQDVNILKKEYSKYSNFPDTIDVKIQHVYHNNQINNHSVQYMSHLPLGSDYRLIEVDVQPHIKDELYQHYRGMLKARVKTHEKVKKQENLNKKKGERREFNKMMKQVADEYKMTPDEFAEMTQKTPRDSSKPLPSLSALRTTEVVVPAIEKLNVNDYSVGERVKVEGAWYTLKKNIWGELRFEKDKEVVLNNENSMLLEMFNKKMNI
ncbi:hypothetical protein ACO0R3_001618 [Hanseniaspora guilliermondii]